MSSEQPARDWPSDAAATIDRVAPAAPSGAAALVLPVDRIAPYDRNPRHSTNPEYDRIKVSIRASGMQQPLVVTQRPGASQYLVQAGGNTRLQILRELYQETGDPRFGEVACLHRPWTCEADVLLAHLRENDLRGDLTFLDRALAVREARRLIQEERGEEQLTQAQLAETLRSRGYALSQARISQMGYTVERLLPVIPTALGSGLGRPQVERIRHLERAVHALWIDRCVDTEEEFEQAFSALCRRYDSPDWDLGNLRRALEAEIAARAEVSIHAVSLVLEGYLAGRRGAEAGAPWRTGIDAGDDAEATPDTERLSVTDTPESAPTPPSTREDHQVVSPEVDQPLPNDSADAPKPSSADRDTQPSSEEATDTLAVEDKHPVKPESRAPTELKSLRARAWTVASRLAQRNGLSELVEPLSGQGLGFLLRDVPDPALVDQLDEDTLAQVSMVWWHLAAAAEVTVAPVERLLPGLAEESVLRRALEDQDAGLLFSSIWTLDPGHMGFRLWRRLDGRDWRDLIDLMETYRALHQAAEASGDPLWP